MLLRKLSRSIFMLHQSNVGCMKTKVSTLVEVRNYTTRRAILYVPGDQQKKLDKSVNLDVDCIAMDCEDGVAINRKDVARENIVNMLNRGPVSAWQQEWSVRVNSVESGLCKQDLEAVLTAKNLPPTLLLPKVEQPEDIEWFSETLSELLSPRSLEVKLNLVIYIESAVAMMDLPEICTAAKELSASAPFQPVALVLGSDDLCASIGAVRTNDGMELLYCRQRLVLIAKAFDLQAIDMVHIQFNDLVGLKEQCEVGKRMGFTGKQVIHPCQIPVVQETFLPSKEAIAWAQGLVKAFYEHQQRGQGVFVYKGSMIDKPSLRQAENILHVAEAAQGKRPQERKH